MSATLATDATHLEDGDTSFSLILLLSEIGFTGDEVSVLSSISATLATDATHVGDGDAPFSLISVPNLLSFLSIESLLSHATPVSLSYSCSGIEIYPCRNSFGLGTRFNINS